MLLLFPLLAQRLRFLPHGDDPFMLPGGNWLGRAGPGCCAGFAFYFLTSFMNSSFIKYASADKEEVELAEGRE